MRQNVLRLAVLLVCAIALAGAYLRTKPSAVMAGAAHNFVASLSAEQKAKASFGMGDEERLNWHFIPRERKGLPLREMDSAQRALAHAFLSAGLSQRGYLKASTIMSLEAILREMEGA